MSFSPYWTHGNFQATNSPFGTLRTKQGVSCYYVDMVRQKAFHDFRGNDFDRANVNNQRTRSASHGNLTDHLFETGDRCRNQDHIGPRNRVQ